MRRLPLHRCGVLAGLLVASASARAQAPPPIAAGRAIAQGAAGLGLMPVGFIGGGLATRWAAHRLGADDETASPIALVGAYTMAALTTAAGPTLVGGGPHGRGSYAAALAGAAIGGVGSLAIIGLNKLVNIGRVPRIVSAIAVALLPPTGSTIGYDWSRSYRR